MLLAACTATARIVNKKSRKQHASVCIELSSLRAGSLSTMSNNRLRRCLAVNCVRLIKSNTSVSRLRYSILVIGVPGF